MKILVENWEKFIEFGGRPGNSCTPVDRAKLLTAIAQQAVSKRIHLAFLQSTCCVDISHKIIRL